MKLQKAKRLLEEDRIFKISSGNRYDFYICKGFSGFTYDITYDKLMKTWICTCKNLRLNCSCYHLVGTQLLKKYEKNE